MKCSSGCGAAAEVVASRPVEAAVLLLCWDHGKGLAAVPNVRVRPLRSVTRRPGRSMGTA